MITGPTSKNPEQNIKVLFIGKRHYTSRDAFLERYGRIYQLPLHWTHQGANAELWLIDYHGASYARKQDCELRIESTPIRCTAWVFKALVVLLKQFTDRRFTHFVASGDAYIGLLGWLLARLTGARFIFDVYDKYDEFGAYRRPFGRDLFGFLLQRADLCWFASRRLMGQLGNPSRGDLLVMNGIDGNLFKPQDMQEARARLGLPKDALLIGYFGGINTERGIVDLIDATNLLRTKGIKISLILAGKLEEEISLNSPGIHYLGNLPHSEIPWALAAVNVVVVPYRRSPFLDSASSVKFGEIMACGRPMVATLTPNIEENFPQQVTLLRDYLIPPGQPEAIAQAISLQLRDKKIAPPPAEIDWMALAASTLISLEGIAS